MRLVDLLGTFVHGGARAVLFGGACARQCTLIIQLHALVDLIDN